MFSSADRPSHPNTAPAQLDTCLARGPLCRGCHTVSTLVSPGPLPRAVLLASSKASSFVLRKYPRAAGLAVTLNLSTL